jgi:nucleotide-binding universal stress UspA family protein
MFKHVLVPVDPNEIDFAKPAMTAAADLVAQSSGDILLVAVMPVMNGYVTEFLPSDFEAGFEKETTDRIRTAAAEAGIDLARAAIELRTGSVYHEVIDLAGQRAADLIVVTSHRPAMSTYLLGSNAAKIVRHAPCSVLVLRG